MRFASRGRKGQAGTVGKKMRRFPEKGAALFLKRCGAFSENMLGFSGAPVGGFPEGGASFSAVRELLFPGHELDKWKITVYLRPKKKRKIWTPPPFCRPGGAGCLRRVGRMARIYLPLKPYK